jgi:hypothetical protein
MRRCCGDFDIMGRTLQASDETEVENLGRDDELNCPVYTP